MHESMGYSPEFDKGERRVVQTSVAEIFPGGIDEPEGLLLVDAPMTLTSEGFDGGTVFTAAIDAPLRGENFSLLLNAISPLKPFGIGEILADWTMPDQKFSQGLLKKHTDALGDEWIDFEEHRKAFIKAIGQKRHPHELAGEIRSSVFTYDQARERYLQKGGLARKYQAFAKMHRDDPRFIQKRAEILAFMAEQQKEGKAGQQHRSPSELYGMFFDRYGSKGRGLFTDFFRQNPEFLREEDIEKYMGANGLKKFEGESTSVYLKEDNSPWREGLRFKIAGDSVEVRVPNDSDPLILPITQKDDQYEVVIADDIVKDPSLKPIIVWAKMDARLGPKRSIMTSSETASYYHDLDENYDPLLGYLVLPYFEPDLRDRWPERQSLMGGRYQQSMKAAQVPVLALRYQRRFTNRSRFLGLAEQFVEENGQSEVLEPAA